MGCSKVDKNKKFHTLGVIESRNEEIRLLSKSHVSPSQFLF